MHSVFLQKKLSRLSTFVKGLPASHRRLILLAVDTILLPLSVWLSFWLRLSQPFSPSLSLSYWLFPLCTIYGLLIYFVTGHYKSLSRYVGSTVFYNIFLRNGILTLLLIATGVIARLPLPPRSSWFLLWFLLTALTSLFRFLLRDALLYVSRPPTRSRKKVVIYGAGSAGSELAAAVKLSGVHHIIAFVDDAPQLWHRDINSIPIYPPSFLTSQVDSVDQVLLAIPSINRASLRRITNHVQQLGLLLLQVPSLSEIAKGTQPIDSLRPIQIDQLLGRDPVKAQPQFLGPGVTDHSVCVTGAGGSIGSELCRQILQLSPSSLILIDNSEPSLHSIYQQLKELSPTLPITPLLCDLSNTHELSSLFSSLRVQTVFHAAAYKHVPLVEVNPLSGIQNNVFSAYSLCQACCQSGVDKVVLVSTDKAVRPTNVMGATKRVAELIFQAFASNDRPIAGTCESTDGTSFSLVRFGNVIGSSGSVVPLFTHQITKGGPVTVTDPAVTRFFMTINEAAQLVLQASALASSGDLLLLDMGEPVSIDDLARQMICLSGSFVRDPSAPIDEGISIVYTGLRPGEKLYEELLIDAKSLPTQHPLIFRARESQLQTDILFPLLDRLRAAVKQNDVSQSLDILRELVPEWKSSTYA